MNTSSDQRTDAPTAWQNAAAIYRHDEPPPELEATLLARFGEVRAAANVVPSVPLKAARPHVSWWSRIAAPSRVRPVWLAACSTAAVAAIGLSLWLTVFRAAPDVTTPFMLVAEPDNGKLNVAQMVRVSVSREAMLDFGIPVPPQQLQEPVRAEMLLGQRGELLAVRFIEKPAPRRFSFD